MKESSQKDAQTMQSAAARQVLDTAGTAQVPQINPNADARIKLMSEKLAATIANTDIVPRFSTSNKYNGVEQSVINQAIEILSSRVVDQSPSNQFTSSENIKNFLQLKLATCEREIFAVIFMDCQNRLISYEELNIGTIDSANIYTREIIKRALDHNAARLILSHNHPTGNLEPSRGDDNVTHNIEQAAKMFNIEVIDHIIVSPLGTVSYAEEGKMGGCRHMSPLEAMYRSFS